MRDATGKYSTGRPPVEVVGGMKRCERCDTAKPIKAFDLKHSDKAKIKRLGVCAKCRNRDDYAKQKARGTVTALRAEVMEAYGGACACCGDNHQEFLTIDHLGNWGYQERLGRKRTHTGTNLYRRLKREGFPKDRFRILCHNCNFSIGMLGYCPHNPTARYPLPRELKLLTQSTQGEQRCGIG